MISFDWVGETSLLFSLYIYFKPSIQNISALEAIMMTSTQMMFKNHIFAVILIGTLLYSGNVSAQLGQQLDSADPGRIERNLTDRPFTPQVGPNIKIKKFVPQNAPAGAENIKFNFGGVSLEGASIYSEDDLAYLYKGMIGTEISLADLYAIANRMTLKYRNDGFILTQVVVPIQTIESGIAQLQVVEGFIDNVVIQGGEESTSALKIIEQYASRISTGGALNISNMERQLLLINDLPGVMARSIISPSKTTSGAADMLIIIERDPFEAIAGINNHGSRFLGLFQADGTAQFNSWLGFNETISAQFVLAPDAGVELAFGSLRYEQPVGPLGTRLSLTGSITDTDPGFTLDAFDVRGSSKSIRVEATHPFIRSRNTNVLGRFSFDWRDVDSRNNIELTREDRIRALRTGARVDFLDRILGVAVNTLDLQISQGIDVLGASDEGDANLSRALGDPTFTKGNIVVQRLQRVNNSVNILLEGRGQLSNNPLLSSEEFGLGGISSVRGYAPSEVVGDDGIAGSVEVQWNEPSGKTQFFGFLDSGTVWDQDATSSATQRSSLTSTGLGVRVDLPFQVNAEFVAAQPLHRDIETRNERSPQFFFSLNKEF